MISAGLLRTNERPAHPRAERAPLGALLEGVLEDDHLASLAEELKPEETNEKWLEYLPAVLANLDSGDLQIIELRFFEGRPFKEVAFVNECPRRSLTGCGVGGGVLFDTYCPVMQCEKPSVPA